MIMSCDWLWDLYIALCSGYGERICLKIYRKFLLESVYKLGWGKGNLNNWNEQKKSCKADFLCFFADHDMRYILKKHALSADFFVYSYFWPLKYELCTGHIWDKTIFLNRENNAAMQKQKSAFGWNYRKTDTDPILTP